VCTFACNVDSGSVNHPGGIRHNACKRHNLPRQEPCVFAALRNSSVFAYVIMFRAKSPPIWEAYSEGMCSARPDLTKNGPNMRGWIRRKTPLISALGKKCDVIPAAPQTNRKKLLRDFCLFCI
jgi:hypothetical protein